MSVRIRMKRMGRRHRPYFRICAMESRAPRDGRVLEELGTYDPMVPETDARAVLDGERIDHWLSVGALATEKVSVLIKKYGKGGTHLEQQRAALDRMAQSRRRPELLPAAPRPKESETKEQPAESAAAAPEGTSAGDNH